MFLIYQPIGRYKIRKQNFIKTHTLFLYKNRSYCSAIIQYCPTQSEDRIGIKRSIVRTFRYQPKAELLHCKNKLPKFRNKYSKKRNIGVSVPISTFMHLWAIYIFPQSVSLFCWRKYVDRSWDYTNRSQIHECWNWGWVRAIPRKGIHKGDFRCSVVGENVTRIVVELLFLLCERKSSAYNCTV